MNSSLSWRLAWRNLGRNPRRTLITGGAIVAGVSLCIAVGGLTDGLDADLIRSVTRMSMGEIQVHRPGYLEKHTLTLTMDDPASTLRSAAAEPGVSAASPRLFGWGLATNARRSIGVQLVGVDPNREARVTSLPQSLVSGSWLREAPTPWPERQTLSAEEQALDDKLTQQAMEAALDEIDGKANAAGKPAAAKTRALVAKVAPTPSAPLPVLLGARLAERLQVHAGDRISLLAERSDGGTSDVALVVIGVFRSGTEEIDQARVVLHLTDLQRLLHLEGRAHEIALRVEARERAAEIAAALAGKLRGFSVKSWDVLRPDIVAMVRANDTLTQLIVLSVFALAGLGVVNTMLMAVFDRRRELGVLGALGLRPWSMLVMIGEETLLLAGVAALAGLGAGVGLDLYLARFGLDVSFVGSFSLAGVGLQPVLHAAIRARSLVTPVAVMVTLAALGSLFPAALAARVQPAAAMRAS
jgi:ABC-type lipoprotein release transport system permease subunit